MLCSAGAGLPCTISHPATEQEVAPAQGAAPQDICRPGGYPIDQYPVYFNFFLFTVVLCPLPLELHRSLFSLCVLLVPHVPLVMRLFLGADDFCQPFFERNHTNFLYKRMLLSDQKG